MSETLRLQDLGPLVETRSDLHRSTNSVYACLAASALSVVCPR